MATEDMDKVPCQVYKATVSEFLSAVSFIAFKSNEALINSVDDAGESLVKHFESSFSDATT